MVDLTFAGAFKAHVTEALSGPTCWGNHSVRVRFSLAGRLPVKSVFGREVLKLKTGSIIGEDFGSGWMGVVVAVTSQSKYSAVPPFVSWDRTSAMPGTARWSRGVLRFRNYLVKSNVTGELRISGTISCP